MDEFTRKRVIRELRKGALEAPELIIGSQITSLLDEFPEQNEFSLMDEYAHGYIVAYLQCKVLHMELNVLGEEIQDEEVERFVIDGYRLLFGDDNGDVLYVQALDSAEAPLFEDGQTRGMYDFRDTYAEVIKNIGNDEPLEPINGLFSYIYQRESLE